MLSGTRKRRIAKQINCRYARQLRGRECHCRRRGEEITTRKQTGKDSGRRRPQTLPTSMWIAVITMRCSLHMLDSPSDFCLLGTSYSHYRLGMQFGPLDSLFPLPASSSLLVPALPKPSRCFRSLHSSALCDLEVMSRIYFATTRSATTCHLTAPHVNTVKK